MRRTDGLIVGIVGATGMVGRELIALLESRHFPIAELRPFSSGLSPSSIRFKGLTVKAPGLSTLPLTACDVVFFVSSDAVARKHAPSLAARGVWTIDDSAAFRLIKNIPLVIPEVNAAALRADRRLISSPNCTMTGLAVAGAVLHRDIGIRAVRLASYQSVSGAGKAALFEMFSQYSSLSDMRPGHDGRAPVLGAGTSSVLPRAIAYNAIPQVGRFGADGYSSEETKVAAELRKIWSAPKLKVSVTAVRVPSIRGHALAAWLTLARPITLARARTLLSQTPGLVLSRAGNYPTPRSVGGKNPVYAGRLRQGLVPTELALWIASDNLLKGAALNSVQVAEELRRRGWLKPRKGR